MTDTGSDAQALGAIDEYLARTADERLADYIDFLRIPSIGALSGHDADTARAADFLVQRLNAMGIKAESSPTPGAPTVIVYGHYDVQPVDPLDLWVRPPFEPRVEDGRIYARGAAHRWRWTWPLSSAAPRA